MSRSFRVDAHQVEYGFDVDDAPANVLVALLDSLAEHLGESGAHDVRLVRDMIVASGARSFRVHWSGYARCGGEVRP